MAAGLVPDNIQISITVYSHSTYVRKHAALNETSCRPVAHERVIVRREIFHIIKLSVAYFVVVVIAAEGINDCFNRAAFGYSYICRHAVLLKSEMRQFRQWPVRRVICLRKSRVTVVVKQNGLIVLGILAVLLRYFGL